MFMTMTQSAVMDQIALMLKENNSNFLEIVPLTLNVINSKYTRLIFGDNADTTVEEQIQRLDSVDIKGFLSAFSSENFFKILKENFEDYVINFLEKVIEKLSNSGYSEVEKNE